MGPSEPHSKTGFVVNGIKSELTTFIHTSLLKVSLVVMVIPTVGLAVGMSRRNNGAIGFSGGLANISVVTFFFIAFALSLYIAGSYTKGSVNYTLLSIPSRFNAYLASLVTCVIISLAFWLVFALIFVVLLLVLSALTSFSVTTDSVARELILGISWAVCMVAIGLVAGGISHLARNVTLSFTLIIIIMLILPMAGAILMAMGHNQGDLLLHHSFPFAVDKLTQANATSLEGLLEVGLWCVVAVACGAARLWRDEA